MVRTIDKLANSAGIVTIVAGQTSHGSAGTSSTHAINYRNHVGRRIAPTAVIPVARDAAASIAVISFDADEVTVEASENEVEFDLILI